MKCPKCGSTDFAIVSETSGKVRGRGCLMTCIHIFLVIATVGLWLIVPLLKSGTRGKIKTQTVAVCKQCGNKWKWK